MNGKRAAIYTRVSSKGQEDGTSLESQAQACREYAAECGYEVAEVFVEVETADDFFWRPQLTRLREMVRAGHLDVVVTLCVDRWSRNQAHQFIVEDEIERAGCEIEYAIEKYDKTPEGKFMRSAKAFIAEVELTKLTYRTQTGRRARAESGKPIPGRSMPLGYRWADDEHTRYAIDDSKAWLIERIFTECRDGVPLREIARRLDADGIPSPRGALWGLASLRVILHNSAYTGKAYAYRTKSHKVNGKYRHETLPQEQWIELPPGTFPAIISEETYNVVQEKLIRNKAEATRNNPNPENYLLRAGFARCGVCGAIMTALSPKGEHSARYACARPSGSCATPTITAAELDAAVWARVEYILLRPETIAAELRRLQENDPTIADMDIIDKGLVSIARKRTNLARRLAMIDDDEIAAPLMAELTSLANQKRQLEADRENVIARQSSWRIAGEHMGGLEQWCRSVAERLDTLSYEERRLALHALGVDVKVYLAKHNPRYVITASVPMDGDIVGSTTCNTTHNKALVLRWTDQDAAVEMAVAAV